MPPKHPMPRPFLKWAGGKRALFAAIEQRMPAQIDAYVEPFVGGGAVFFGLQRSGRLQGTTRLADRNPELVHLWNQIRTNVEAVIEHTHDWEPVSEVFYEVRASRPNLPAKKAARTLWLNRYCYNGLYRLNSKGGFNVPFGKYKNARINLDNLRLCAEALQNVEIVCADFDGALSDLPPNAVVYLDPPYDPVSRTSNFNRYDGQAFDESDQRRLAQTFYDLHDHTVACAVLSNSDTPLTRELYPTADTVQVRRPINSKASSRGVVNELLVTLPPRA
ncbi:MAG: DNA adenine methylase [Bradymonadia bacterium]|jgi:DNA adenine methylase